MVRKGTLLALTAALCFFLSCKLLDSGNRLKRALILLLIPRIGSSYYPSYTVPETIPANAIYVNQNHPAASDGNPGTIDLPYKSIKGAINGARPGPGSTIAVMSGTYYENNIRIPGGEQDNPFVIMADPSPSARVIVSGLVRLSPANGYSWTHWRDNIYYTTLAWKPQRVIYIDGSNRYYEKMPVRYPREYPPVPLDTVPVSGWLAVDSVSNNADSNSFTDGHLINFNGIFGTDLVGGEVFLSVTEGGITAAVPVIAFDNATGTVTFPRTQYVTLTNTVDQNGDRHRDRYWIQNKKELIYNAGEWAVEKPDPDNNSRYVLYYKPYDNAGGTVADIIGIPGHQLQRIIHCERNRHAKVVGFEVVGSDQYGIQVGYNSRNILVAKCVSHHHDSAGITVNDSEEAIVVRNIVWRNGSGIVETGCSKVLIEKNDVAYNWNDGLDLTWDSDNITVQKNYVHGHIFWGHPDNIQTYRDVRNITIKDNLLIGGGQSIMMEETINGEISGNVIMGCAAYSLIFGNVPNFNIFRNTIVHSYYGSLALTGYNYDIRENVMMTGNRGSVYSTRDSRCYTGDRNLFYNADVGYDGILITTNGWGRTLAQFQQDTGQDRSSVFGNPRFAALPDFFTQVEMNMIHECDTDKLIISNSVDWLYAGDTIEVNFDGVARVIQAKTAHDGNHYAITLNAPLSKKPVRICLIAKWTGGLRPMDAQLLGSSPGFALTPGGGPVGSGINVQQYKTGSFDGDGVRNIPGLVFE